jgi:hypothetical protein
MKLNDDSHAKALTSGLKRIFSTEDAVVILIRGMLIVENQLERCLDRFLLHGMKPFAGLRLFFEGKLILAHGVGLIGDAEYKLLSTLVNLRNKVAHKFEAELTVEDERVFNETLVRVGFVANAEELTQDPPTPFIDLLKFTILIISGLLIARESDLKEHVLKSIAPFPNEDFWSQMALMGVITYALAHIGDVIDSIVKIFSPSLALTSNPPGNL